MVVALNHAYGIGAFRTIDEDPAFGIRQLVDMALKALSPGINDTTTAVTCIEHLGMILEDCARRNLNARHHYDGGVLRVAGKGPGFPSLARLAFAQIIESAGGNTVVLARLLATLGTIACPAARREVGAAVRAQVDVIEEVAMRTAKSRTVIDELLAEVDEVRTRTGRG